MSSVLVTIMLCAVATTNILTKEIVRLKRQTFEIEDRWVWGYFEDKPPVVKENYLVPINSVRRPEENNKGFSNTAVKSKFTDVLKKSPSIVTDLPITSTTFKFTNEPFISKLVANPHSTTTSTTITAHTNDPTVLTSWGEINDAKNSTIKPINQFQPIKATRTLLGNLRSLNSPKKSTNTNDITTEVAPTEPTTDAPETTTPDFCDPLPGKPDFSAPGRRLSEAQCMGYVWELKNRIKEFDQNKLCNAGSKFGINHAIGGRKTAIGEFPHMGALGWKATIGTWVFKCGSSLISANFVLTAAHCAQASSKDTTIADTVPKIVRLGDKLIVDVFNFFTFPTDANIHKIIVHPQYKSPMQYYDIALMELEEPVEFTKLIQPACLWSSPTTGDIGHEATLTGWGVIQSGSTDISPELQAATVDVLETSQCDELLKYSHSRNWKGFQDHQLCAGKLEGGVDSCQGDSGGPLQMKMPLPNDITAKQGSMHYIIGVIAFGVGCAHPNLPGIYTRVYSFLDWIEDNVWRNGHNRTYVKPPPSNVLTGLISFG